MEMSFAKRSSLLATLTLFFQCFVTVAAAAELPFLPPLDLVQSSAVDLATSQLLEAQSSRIMSGLIESHFKDQVRWRLFLQDRDQSPHHTYHRVVREHRPRPSVPSTRTTSKNMDRELGSSDLAVHQFHLRGNPSPPPLLHLQTIAEVVEVPGSQRHIPAEVASQ